MEIVFSSCRRLECTLISVVAFEKRGNGGIFFDFLDYFLLEFRII